MKKLLFLLSVMVLMGCSEKAAKDQGASFENETKGSAIDKLGAMRRESHFVALYSKVVDPYDFQGAIMAIHVEDEESDEKPLRLLFIFQRQTKNPTFASSLSLKNGSAVHKLCTFKEKDSDNYTYDAHAFFYNYYEESERISCGDVCDDGVDLLRKFVNGKSPQLKLVGKNTAIIPLTAKEIKAMKEVMEGYDELMQKMQEKGEKQAMEDVKKRYY